MNVKILVATHKQYRMPSESYYLPIHVGRCSKNDLGYIGDDSGDNISSKNTNYCELTGIYWAWKNLDADYIGLSHYRRHFKSKYSKKNDIFNSVLTNEEIDALLKKSDVILPKKRNYYIENLYDHYKHTMHIEPLDITGDVIKEIFPQYYDEFLRLKTRKSAHMFNMFIMKREYFNDYCKWLFEILFEVEKRSADLKFDEFHSRFYGRISELLLDIWINTNKVKYIEVPFMHMEKVNWINKGGSFLLAKFLNKKYKKSF